MITQKPIPKTVLVVDDDPDFLLQHKALLRHNGLQVLTAEGSESAEAILERQRPDLAVVDLMMETADAGFTLCHRIKQTYPDLPVIMVTSVNSETGLDFDTITQEQRSWIKADAFLAKPIRHEQLTQQIDRLL
jgi:CheY-like chemotaxis protein